MRKLKTLNVMTKRLTAGLLAAALTALIALHAGGAAVEAAAGLWSVAVHIEYQDGFSYDYVFARGVSTADMADVLEACGSSHMYARSVVRYHCYPIPE
jgi:hypothetical protein